MRRQFAFLALLAGLCRAQAGLSQEEAVNRALRSRASLRAEGERIAAAEGLKKQASLRPNPEFQFQNENLRPGQTYGRDVDTLAMINQPLDVLGKRRLRIAWASDGVGRTQAEYELARWQIAQSVKVGYWTARGAEEVREVLKSTVENFQKIIDYHAAQLSAGAIAEQDLLRVRLEGERLRISANLAAIEANRARIGAAKTDGPNGFLGGGSYGTNGAGCWGDACRRGTGFGAADRNKSGASGDRAVEVEWKTARHLGAAGFERDLWLQADPIAGYAAGGQYGHCLFARDASVGGSKSGQQNRGAG